MSLSVFEEDVLLVRIKRGDACIHNELDAPLGVEVRRAQRDPILLRSARQEVFREIRTIDGRRVVRGEHGDWTVISLPTQDVRGGEAGGASPDDDDGRRHGTRRWPCGPGRFGRSFPDVGQVADSLYAPTGNRIQRWGTHRLAGGQAEAGVVPWAPNGVTDDKPVDQRAVIVRAVWANRKHRIARSNEQHLFLIDPTKDLRSVRKIPDRESAAEIG